MMNDPVRIRQALRSASYEEALAERLGMNVTDLRCLELVLDEPGMTPGRMAERSGLTTGAVTGRSRPPRARRATSSRTSDPLDRRRQVVQPTPAAEDAAPRSAALDETIDGLLGVLPGRATAGDPSLPWCRCERPSTARPTSCARASAADSWAGLPGAAGGRDQGPACSSPAARRACRSTSAPLGPARRGARHRRAELRHACISSGTAAGR